MLTDSNLTQANITCHICGSSPLSLLTSYPNLPRVASDCVPWRKGGRLGFCNSCLCVQNPVDEFWHAETAEIYKEYRIYKQSAGSEQGVITQNQQLMPRSAKIFQNALPYLDLSKPGYLLDIGCANGELLRYFSTIAPNWRMVGFEIDDKRRQEVESIPGVEAFASGSLAKIKQKFDIITLVHVLEHLPSPKKWLQDLSSLLNPNGFILIQVPDPKQNPFNLLVADHCSHFIMADLINIAKRADYQIVACSDQWVTREFSLLITRNTNTNKQASKQVNFNEERTSSYPQTSIKWLQEVSRLVKQIPEDCPRGIWGTAIAATWIYSIMGNIDFFVDEDPNRINQQHLGKPVYSPDKIPEGSHVFIALTPEIAAKIYQRWSQLKIKLYTPPNLNY